ncbi:hypothetical protein EDF68_10312 [Ochrobactrum sp. BH3]|nr:hypothetical protein EDF68_10312 [Ochrobactrum sp. BH3]
MSRHKSLAGAMTALMAYKNRPESEIIPVSTNWNVVPENSNEPEVISQMHTERRIQILPTVEEIMRNVGSEDIERNDLGQIVRIGRLKFSDGTQVEAGNKYGPGGEVIATKHRMPAGAMLGCREQESRALGGDENPSEVAASNNYFLAAFELKRRERIPSGKKTKRTYQTHDQAKEDLAKAYANTPALPPVTRCRPGLPNAGNRIGDSFLGMKKTTTGESGSMGWQDVSSALVDREIWAQAIEALSERDRTAMDTAAHGKVRNYEGLGISLGFKTEYSRRKGGRKALTAANDNLQENIKRFSA